ncbi:MAG: GMC family oxidoreductase, partial [Pseudomonadota bacterium]
KSRGTVTLASSDPAAMPRVSPNLLKHPDDMAAMVEGQRFFLRAMETDPLGAEVERVMAPAADARDDEGLKTHCRRMVKTNYHPAGTCRMGADGDAHAVLDARLRVRGIDGLRVCDMSAVPDINAGNTNAPAMMLGARCAEFLLADA